MAQTPNDAPRGKIMRDRTYELGGISWLYYPTSLPLET